MGCEVCGAAHAVGAMVPGAALTKGEIVQLCLTCRDDVGAGRHYEPSAKRPAFAAFGWMTLGLSMFFAMLSRAHLQAAHDFSVFFLGAIGYGAVQRAMSIARAEDARAALPAAPRRPAIAPDVERARRSLPSMSRDELYAKVAAHGGAFDLFERTRDNGAEFDAALKEVAVQFALVDKAITVVPSPQRAQLVCPEPRMNTVIKDIERPHPESCGCDHCVAWRRHVALVNRCGVC